ncbi:hypothetical protein [Paenibacillus sp. 481]|uniref:hypothetical protein n=1 Tax=Paenibacillus sp. 481 TaxID=2835869 RepID=UPI001E4E76B8|nr:hypothetical protein [Paenibacillus sp. 481]UHA71786.1 hypothetical protein KIK04_13525 [Paenibacillus sp. 481]
MYRTIITTIAVCGLLVTGGAITQLQAAASLPAQPALKDGMRTVDKSLITRADVIGTWHNKPSVGASYSDSYHLYKDGSYIFAADQMACTERIVGHEGTWKLENQDLIIQPKVNHVRVGGKLEPSSGSGACESAQQLTGAKLVHQPTNEHARTLPLASWQAKSGKGDSSLPVMTINKVPFWQLSNVPLQEREAEKEQKTSANLEAFKKAQPKESVAVHLEADIDLDKRNETYIIAESGRMYVVKGATVRLQADGVRFNQTAGEPKLEIVEPSPGVRHLAVMYYYVPSNTGLIIYSWANGELNEVFDITGDLDVQWVDKKTIVQESKKFRGVEDGDRGWDPVATFYSWDAKLKQYVEHDVHQLDQEVSKLR